MKRQWLLMAVILAGSLLPAVSAQAQKPGYYRPARPTISPYLNYFRRDVGLMNPYNTFVRPQRELTQNIQQAERERATLKSEVSGLRQSGASPTGVGAGFMNYSHYYSMGGGGRQR